MAGMVSNGGAWSLESGMRVNSRLNLLWNFVTLLNLLEPPSTPHSATFSASVRPVSQSDEGGGFGDLGF